MRKHAIWPYRSWPLIANLPSMSASSVRRYARHVLPNVASTTTSIANIVQRLASIAQKSATKCGRLQHRQKPTTNQKHKGLLHTQDPFFMILNTEKGVVDGIFFQQIHILAVSST